MANLRWTEVAAAKAGSSARSGYRIIRGPTDATLTEEGPAAAAVPGPSGRDIRGRGSGDAHSP